MKMTIHQKRVPWRCWKGWHARTSGTHTSHTEEKVVCRVYSVSRFLITVDIEKFNMVAFKITWKWMDKDKRQTTANAFKACLYKSNRVSRTQALRFLSWYEKQTKKCCSFEFRGNWTCVGRVCPVALESLLGCDCNMKQHPTSTRSLHSYLFIEKGEWKKRCDAGGNNKSCLPSKKAWEMIYAFMTVSMYLCSVTLVSTDRWLQRITWWKLIFYHNESDQSSCVSKAHTCVFMPAVTRLEPGTHPGQTTRPW